MQRGTVQEPGLKSEPIEKRMEKRVHGMCMRAQEKDGGGTKMRATFSCRRIQWQKQGGRVVQKVQLNVL